MLEHLRAEAVRQLTRGAGEVQLDSNPILSSTSG
jgi:hypothetical protein